MTRKTLSTSILSLVVLSMIFIGGTHSSANAISLTIDPASAKWTTVSGATSVTGLNTDQVRWGNPASSSGQKSGLNFDVITTPTSVQTNTPFELGTLTHVNFPVFGGASGATLAIDMTVTNGGTENAMFTFDLDIDETQNTSSLSGCGPDQQSTTPCDDVITFPSSISSQTVTIDDVEFNLVLLGFGSTSDSLINKFITEEFQSSQTTLWAQLDSNEPPSITAPADFTVECSETGGSSGIVLGDPDIDDLEDADADLTVNDNAPSLFGLGSTTVTWTVFDTDSNSDTDDQIVTVVDTTAPTLSIPTDLTVPTNEPSGWTGDLGTAIASDICDDDVQITNNAVFPLGSGENTITWTATDDDGNSISATQIVLVNNPPQCDDANANQGILWPPNHKMNEITIEGVTDLDDDPITITISSIFQDEPTNGLGDGDESPDAAGIGTSTGEVRAERSGLENGRVYHISFDAEDGNGGMCSGTVTVGVPHDKKDTPGDEGPLHNSTS